MPDKRMHRGPHPQDAQLFAPREWPRLRAAVADLSWLLNRGYAGTAALKLVGDRYQLAARQRVAVARCACSDAELASRRARQVAAEHVAGRRLLIDGYNVLTTLEAALAGGVVLVARDGCYRDMASMHGSYRKVEETMPALELMARSLQRCRAAEVVCLLDSPVSNSGRLKGLIEQTASWQVQLVPNPDPLLAAASEIVATADSIVLDRCGQWFNLARWIIDQDLRGVCLVDLAAGDGPSASG